jgi:hypothetical protein
MSMLGGLINILLPNFLNLILVQICSIAHNFLVSNIKAIRATGREGPYGCETPRLPHFLDNRLTDGVQVVSLTRRPTFTPQEDSWYSFLLEAGRIRSIEKHLMTSSGIEPATFWLVA